MHTNIVYNLKSWQQQQTQRHSEANTSRQQLQIQWQKLLSTLTDENTAMSTADAATTQARLCYLGVVNTDLSDVCPVK